MHKLFRPPRAPGSSCEIMCKLHGSPWLNVFPVWMRHAFSAQVSAEERYHKRSSWGLLKRTQMEMLDIRFEEKTDTKCLL